MSEDWSFIVRSEPLTEQVYRYLKSSILERRLLPGEKLVETKLATSLQISRSPVREAIRMLIAEHLLISENGSVFVFVPSLEDCRQIYELRVALESKACELAISNFTDVYYSKFEKNLKDTEVAVREGDTDRLIDLNSTFHNLILELAKNERFSKVLADVSALIHYYWRWILEVNSSQTNIVAEHREIYEALLAGDASAMARSMSHHIMMDLSVLENAQRQDQAGR